MVIGSGSYVGDISDARDNASIAMQHWTFSECDLTVRKMELDVEWDEINGKIGHDRMALDILGVFR
jgi:hypothetical protein